MVLQKSKSRSLASADRQRVRSVLHRLAAGCALCGLAVAAIWPAGALAQSTGTGRADIPPDEIEMAADQLTYNTETGDVRAIGRVKLVRDGYVLEAGEIRYNEQRGTAEAVGAVELTMPDGTRILAPRIRLEDNLKRAFVEDIRLLLNDGSQAAAAEGDHDDASGRTTMRRAVYSPCEVCEGDPNDTPLWQIKAVRVVHDRGKRRIYYDDAFIEFLGVPLLWTPTFSHPDSSVERASGLLPPKFRNRRELGFMASLPYHHVFSRSRDLTLTPMITTREGPVLGAEYRQHLGYGHYVTSGSITNTDELDNLGNDTGQNEFRGHIQADGQFQHSDNWRSTFQLAWASDDTYLRLYNFSQADALQNEYHLEGFFDQSYISARSLAFQGLRTEDVAGLTAFALPQVNAEFIPDVKPLGGTVSLRGNALALHRTSGLDTQRLSLSAAWTRQWITGQGLVFDLDALARTDFYNINDADQPDDVDFAGDAVANESGQDRAVARITGMVSWPLVKITGSGSHTLEPLLSLTLSPETGALPSLVNEDSRAFELNAVNLFSSERAAGYDLWQEGSRVTYGLRWRYEGHHWATNMMIGQSLQISGDNPQFFQGSGLSGDVSDIVGQTQISYRNWLTIDHRYRLDDSNLALRRNEIDLRIGQNESFVRFGYLMLDRDLTFINREDREELRANALYKIDRNWSLSGHVIQDLTTGFTGVPDPAGDQIGDGFEGVEFGAGINYRDECFEFGLGFRRTFTRDRDIIPGTQFLFEIRLRNLG